MRQIKHVLLLLILAFISSTILFSGCGKKESNVVKVACNVPLTGDLSTYGIAIRDGSLFALAKMDHSINSDNPKLIFDWQDNAGQAKNAVTIFQKQKNQDFDVYVSGVKPQTMAIIDQFEKTFKPHFVWIFDAFVTEKYKNTFRTWANYKYEPKYYLKYIDSRSPKKIAIIYVKLPHTDEEFNQILIPAIKNRNINNIFVEPYLIDKTEFRDIATKVRSFEPDIIILNGFKGNLIQLIKAFREYNLIKDDNTICTYDLLDAAQDLSPKMLEGLRLVVPQFETRTDNDSLRIWKQNFESKFGRKPLYTDAYSYDMTNIIYNAAIKLKNQKFKDWDSALLNTDLNGITGPLKFDKTGDLILSLDLGYYKNGKLLYEKF